MLEWAKHHLGIRASDEWGYDIIEADPLVQLLIGACAAEAKTVYDAIQDSDDRLHQRLLQYLLPDAFQFPRSAFGIIKVQPTTAVCELSPQQEFKVKTEEKTLSFCPLFETTLLGGHMRFLGLDGRVIECQPGSPYFTGTGTEMVSRILIGIETKEAVESLKNVAVYFDWRGTNPERQTFLKALSGSHWTCNGKELARQVGLATETALLAEQFSAESRLTRQVSSQFRMNFHVITDPDLAPPLPGTAQEVLANWLGSPFEEGRGGGGPGSGEQGSITWLRIDLPYPVLLTDVERNLVIDLNHLPVVNRRLIRKADQSTYFSRSLGFEAIAIQPEEGHFCGIQAILNMETGEEIPEKVFADLLKNEENKLGYSIRYGGMGRYDNLNSWERLSYLLALFRQEHKDREAIEDLGVKLTLEELHEVLGKRILKSQRQSAAKGKSASVYVYFRLSPSQKLDAEVRYWVTDGDEANQIPAGTMLFAEPPIAGVDPTSPRFATATKGGKTVVSEAEQTQILQDILFRRERIVTAHDVKSLCRKIMGEHLQEVTIKPFFEAEMNAQGNIHRAIGVYLKVDQPEELHNQQLGQEIEWILQENSIGTVPYRVKVC